MASAGSDYDLQCTMTLLSIACGSSNTASSDYDLQDISDSAPTS
jgi:hypothetical protein